MAPTAVPIAGRLYRVGRAPDPLALPPLARTGRGRFDDPAGEARVLYLAREPRGAWLERLARFRTAPALRALPGADEVPADWIASRRLGRGVVVLPPGPFLDVRTPETHQVLRRAFALPEFDLGDVLGRDRALTQRIAAWARREGWSGIIYASRYDATQELWALFAPVAFADAHIAPVRSDDQELLAVAVLFGLMLVGA